MGSSRVLIWSSSRFSTNNSAASPLCWRTHLFVTKEPVMSENDQKALSTTLAFDVGGTRLKAGLVSAQTLSSFSTINLDQRAKAGGALASVLHIGRRLLAEQQIDVVGLAIRGIVDPVSGTLLDVNGPLSEYIGQSIALPIAEALGVPVFLENDARMYALGELVCGAGRAYQNIVCLTLGTGVGCSVALERRILRGSRGVGGILAGHITVQVDGPSCTCGNRGCLEALIGTAALTQAIQEALRSEPSSLLRDSPADPQQLFRAAAAGDALASILVERFTRHLGAGIVSLIHTYDPDVVILGGGILHASAQFLPGVQAYVDTHAWTLPRRRVKVVSAQLGDTAALLGIAALIQDPTMLR
jgi:glucokinase